MVDNMQKFENKISQLIVLYIKGKLNEEQLLELNNWLKDSHNKKLFNKIIKNENILNQSLIFDKFNKDRAWKKLYKEINITRRPLIINLIKYAAILAIIISICFTINEISERNNRQQFTQNTKVTPCTKSTIIHFSNGTVVDLTNDTSKIIDNSENLIINKRMQKVLQIKSNTNKLKDEVVKTNKIKTSIGGEYQVILPDSTKVWLNANSQLEFPSRFADKERIVKVKGEVYFNVANNKNKPFIVEIENGIKLKVLGTQFNVRAYENENNVVSTLVKGSVKVIVPNNSNIILRPGRKVVLSKKDNKLYEMKANIKEIISWKNGMFMYDNKRLEDIMIDLQRWYGLCIFYSNTHIRDKRFTLECGKDDDFEKILNYLKGTKDVKFDVKGKVVIVGQ